MSNPISEGVDTTETNEEAHKQIGKELEDVNGAGSSQSTHVTSKAVAQQIRAVVDPLCKQVELLCDL